MNTLQTTLITGGAGFIGSCLARKFVTTTTNAVHILVEKNADLWRLQDILDRLVVHEVDLAQFDAVQTLVALLKPRAIFHLAAFGGMPDQLDAQAIYNVNFYGTINLYQACKKQGFDIFINTGSSSEYGMQNKPMTEHTLLEPISDYAVSKAAATQYCLKEALFYKLPVYTIRPFSAYGDYEMPSRLIPTMITNALNDTTLNLASPHNVRDYIYIHDLIDLYSAVTEKKPNNAFIFNGGTGIQSSTQDVANTLQDVLQKKLNIRWGMSASRPWEPQHWQADITHTSAIVGWKPKHTLHTGLEAAVTWFKNNQFLYDRNKGALRNDAPSTKMYNNTSAT